MAERGLLDNTLIVLTSDHGELHGEYGLMGHAHNLYLPVLHVPLILVFPKAVPAGLRVSAEVSLLDVAPTILDVSGLQEAMDGPGMSLARYWNSDQTDVRARPLVAEVKTGRNINPNTPLSRGSMKSLIANGWQYILNGDGQEELYAVEQAILIGSENNLVSSEEAASVLEQFRNAMTALSDSTQDPPAHGASASTTR